MTSIEAHVWNQVAKQQQTYTLVHFFSLYTRELNFGQTLWDNNPGAIGNILRNPYGNI